MPSDPKPLTKKRYTSLLRDIQKLTRAADKANNTQKVQFYWHMGERVAAEKITQSIGYHNAVLRDLAEDSRVGLRNLQRALRFHTLYPKLPTDSLNWAQYRVLIECADPVERARLHKLALEQHLPARDLALARKAAASGVDPNVLPRPTDASYLYAVRVKNIIDGDTFDFHIDLGFEVWRDGIFRLSDIDCPELRDKGGRAARDFAYSRLMSARTIVVRTLRRDLHGRYVAHLFHSPDELTLHECFLQGHHFNADLITEGHAVRIV